jgi:hypothetical protein
VTTTGVLARHTDNGYDASLLAGVAPPDASVLAFAAQLKAQGLTLTWFPFLVVNQQITVSGTGSDKAAPADFDTWIQAHKAALVHQARLAQQAGAERFVVFADEVQHLMYGNSATAGRTAQWLDVVRAVREVYRGEITTTLYVDGTVFPGGFNHIPRPSGTGTTGRAALGCASTWTPSFALPAGLETPEPPMSGSEQTTYITSGVGELNAPTPVFQPTILEPHWHTLKSELLRFSTGASSARTSWPWVASILKQSKSQS